MSRKVLVLAVLLCVGGILTATGQDVREDIQRLLRVAEDIDENVEDVEDGIDDIGDEIEDMEDEIEDFGEEIEDMKMDVEGVAAELINLREEVKTVRSTLQDIQLKVREVSENGNCSRAIEEGTQSIKQELTGMETSIQGVSDGLETKVEGLEVLIQDNLLEVKEEFSNAEELGNDTNTQVQNLGSTVDSLQEQLSEVKHYTLLLGNHTERDLGDIREELTDLRGDLSSETTCCSGLASTVDSLQGELHEVKEELTSLQRDMNSTLYILQELKEQLINMSLENTFAHQNILPGSCSQLQPNIHSGYYWLNGLSERVYCDMDRQSCGCGNPWGWMRVANIDMTDPNQQCPEGFRLRPGTSKRMCETIEDDFPRTGKCIPVIFPTHSVQYSRVCGRVKAYQYGTPDAFLPYSYFLSRTGTIDDGYVEGVSITYGQSPRKHIWTFAAALYEGRSDHNVCPCTKTTSPYTGVVPPFIGNDYFCDTGSRGGLQYRLYIEDPLWDGEGCGPTSSCCQFNSPPWFCKELPQPITDDIEVRVCKNQERSNEDIPFELIEIYVQ